MKLLTAATPLCSQDFSYVPEGEILYTKIVVCSNSVSCGCDRSLSGTATSKSTTIARVSEVDITEDQLFALAAEVGTASGWGRSFVWASFQTIREALKGRVVGEIVRPKFDFDSEDWVYETVLVEGAA